MTDTRRIVVIVAAVLVVVILLGGGFLIYNSTVNASRAREFKESARSDWKALKARAQDVAAALTRVNSTADLGAVEKAAAGMKTELQRVGKSLKHQKVPAGYGDLAGSQEAAISNLTSYVDMVDQLTRAKDKNSYDENSPLLENRSRKALSSVNDFLSLANFMRMSFPGDFYLAGTTMPRAWQPPAYSNEADSQAAYDAASRFVNADVKEHNFDVMWSMLSNRLISGMVAYKITEQAMANTWHTAWGEQKPFDDYVSRRDTALTDANTATVKVIVYSENSSPRIETMRMVRENNAWKVDAYPFVGWN